MSVIWGIWPAPRTRKQQRWARSVYCIHDFSFRRLTLTFAVQSDPNVTRIWVADQFSALLRNSAIPKTDQWVTDVLDFFILYGLFGIKKKNGKSRNRWVRLNLNSTRLMQRGVIAAQPPRSGLLGQSPCCMPDTTAFCSHRTDVAGQTSKSRYVELIAFALRCLR